MGEYQEVSKRVNEEAKELRRYIPDVWRGFAEMSRAALGDGALSPKVKEIIALAIAVADGCDGCIASHARGAARRGATGEEVAEGLGVAVLMSGGPATIWAPRAFAAYQEFAATHTPTK